MYISIKEASERAQVSQKTIRRHLYANKIKHDKSGSSYKIDSEDFKNWINNFTTHEESLNTSKVISDDFVDVDTKPKYTSIKEEWKNDYWKKPNKEGLKIADFFAGAGGLTTGFVMAGYKPIFSLEIMPQAISTYTKNISARFGNDEIVESSDITNPIIKQKAIDFLKKEQVDVIIGGFPCQGFSLSGPRVVDDPRNSLYMHMLEIVKATQPKVVVMENVLGIRSMFDGKVEKKIITDYTNAGYKINVATLNSADYCVPQQRKRVIFIANKIGVDNLHPEPLLLPNEYKSVKDALENLLDRREDPDFNHEFTRHGEAMSARMANVKEGDSLYEGYSDAWKKVKWNAPSPTVKENHGGVFIHPIANRTMTARELARLQSFPDDFIFKGTKKWQLVQIGNAVPPLMAKAVALSVKKMITK